MAVCCRSLKQRLDDVTLAARPKAGPLFLSLLRVTARPADGLRRPCRAIGRHLKRSPPSSIVREGDRPSFGGHPEVLAPPRESAGYAARPCSNVICFEAVGLLAICVRWTTGR